MKSILWVKYVCALEEFLGEESLLGEEYTGEMFVQEEFLGEESMGENMFVKRMCKKSWEWCDPGRSSLM